MSGNDTRKEHRLFQLPVNPVSPYRNARLFPVGDRSRESVVDFPFICCATLLDNTGYSRIGISRQIHYAQTTNVAGISVLKGFAPRRATLKSSMPSYQLEDGVISAQWAKSFAGRAGGYREIPLHGELIPVEVGLQNFWLFVVWKQTRTELLGSPSFFQ